MTSPSETREDSKRPKWLQTTTATPPTVPIPHDIHSNKKLIRKKVFDFIDPWNNQSGVKRISQIIPTLDNVLPSTR